jgi:hypothetical protein
MGLAGALAIAAGIGLFLIQTRYSDNVAVLAARVDRDCAPWDGSAFTLSIPVEGEPGAMIVISIWRSPDFKLPVTFSFPDEAGGVGNAIYRPAFGPDEPLSGRVSFRRVELGRPVEGRFDLTSESGDQFSESFEAEWGATTIACG